MFFALCALVSARRVEIEVTSEALHLENVALRQELEKLEHYVAELEETSKHQTLSKNPLTIKPFKEFDVQHPVFHRTVQGEPEIYHIVEKPRFGKMPDYMVYYLGTISHPQKPVLLYSHDNKFLTMDANIHDAATKKRILEWRGYKWMSAHAKAKAFLTSPGKNKGNETYYTMTQLTPFGAYRAIQKEQPGSGSALSVTGFIEHFQFDAGRCARRSSRFRGQKCGKRILNAKADRMGGKTTFYTPEGDGKSSVAGESVKINRKIHWFGWADTYSVKVMPGQDPLLMTNFAAFCDASNNVEAAEK